MTPNSTVRSTPQAAPRSPQSSLASAPEGTTRSVQDGVALSSSAVRPNGTSLSESILQAWNVPYDPADVAEALTLRRGLGDESSLPRALDPRHFGTSPRLTPTDEGYDVRGMYGRGTVRVGQDGSIITEGRTPQHDTRSVQTPAEGGGYAEEFRTEYYPGGQRNRPIQQITGGRIEADGSSDVYELNYRADGSLLSTTDEERSGPGDDADFHREHERFDSRGEVVATGHHTRETGSDGVVREREIFDGPNRTVDGHRTILPDGTESGQRTEVNRVANPETDIDGVGWFGSNNPQRVLRELGEPSQLQGFAIERTRYTGDGPVVTNSSLLRSGDGTRELERTTGANGGQIWDYRRVGEDGLVDSQRFFQGTDDTVITERSKEGSIETTHVTSDTPELAARNPGVPSSEDTVIRQGEGVPAEEARRLFADGPMAGLAGTESYAEFFQGAGDAGLTIATYDSTRQVDGQERVDRGFNLVDGEGRQLRGYWDPEGQTFATQLLSPEGEVLRASAATGSPENPQISELDPQAIAAMRERGVGPEQIVDAAAAPRPVGVDPRTQVATATGAVTNFVNIPGVEERIPRALAFAGTAAPGTVPGATAEWLGARGNALAGALAFTAAGESFANGNYTAGMGQLGNGLADVASLGAGATSGGNSLLYRQGFRALGAAGIGLQTYGVMDDAMNGRELRALAGATSVGGTAVALFGSTSWAGPVGWGLAAAGTLGTLAWDFNEATRVAPLDPRFQQS